MKKAEPPKSKPRRCGHCGQPHLDGINGAWLRWRRESAGISLREVARRVGLSAAFLSDIERGNRNAKPELGAAYEWITRRGAA